MAHRIFRSQIGEPMPLMALDAAMPRARLPGAAGGRASDQDPDDDNVKVVESPTQVAYAKLFQFLSDRLEPDDVQEVGEMVKALLGSTDNGQGAAMAGDSRRATPGDSRHFPNAHRLYKRTF